MANVISHNPSNQLDVNNLTCSKGFHTLFEDLDFSVSSGTALQIAGANGTGKTSLLRIICGLSLFDSGVISWNGRSIEQNMSEYRGAVSYLGHKVGLKPDLTPKENLSTLQSLQNFQYPADITLTLKELGIGRQQNRPCRYLSAGQRQRVAFARIVLSQAPIWILDEPATSLDVDGTSILENLVNQHLDNNGILVYTSHTPVQFSSGKHWSLSLVKPST